MLKYFVNTNKSLYICHWNLVTLTFNPLTMIIRILVLALLSIVPYIKIQGQTIVYTYNEQGGCTSRIYSNTSKKSKSIKKTLEKVAPSRVTVSPSASFKDKLTISAKEADDRPLSYILTNISGQVFLKGTSTNGNVILETSNFPKGVYILNVRGEDYEKSYKLLKK